MNSLNYLSRQLDVLATAGTPPSTPIKGTHLFNTERPPRAKSYSKILPRRPSHQNQQPHESDEGNPAHASKRSFSSPALWSFRKPSLTPSSSIPPTPAPALKRTTSYDFGQTTTPEITPPLNRSFIFHILSLLWDTIYRLWLTLSGYLVFPTWITGTGPLLKNLKSGSEGDTTADEGEDEEDDGIVTRAPKRSSVDQQHKDAIALSESLEAFQMSTTTTLVQEELVSHVAPPILSPDPPTEAEVQARTETPRIDLVPPTPRSKTPPSSLRRSQTPSASLLPNPLSSSLLIKSASSPPGPISIPQQTPPRKMPGHHMQKTLVLDLDETLIHSTSKPLRAHAGGGLLSMGGFGFGFGEKRGREAGHMVEVVLGGRCTLYHVYKRPFVDYFLRKVSSWYTLVIFTASMQEYADPVIDWLDAGRGILTRRLFRESCTQLPNGSYTKDLTIIDDLSRVCLIDNSPVSYNVNPANGIPIEGWMSDPSDEALLHLLPVLDSLRFATDVRRILGLRLFS